MTIKKGDTVKIIAGRDAGKTGAVLKVSVVDNRVTVEGVNMTKKRVRARRQGEKGDTVLVPRPLQSSNAMLVCASCKTPSRTGYRFEGEKKVRFCKRCKANT